MTVLGSGVEAMSRGRSGRCSDNAGGWPVGVAPSKGAAHVPLIGINCRLESAPFVNHNGPR